MLNSGLSRRIKSGEIVVNSSDKSKKTIIMDSNLYQECSRAHTDQDSQVTWTQIHKIENKANQLTKAIATALGIGSNQDRWQTALKVVESRPPKTVYNVKDHKTIPEGKLCPETRAVCLAIEGPLSRLEDISSFWLDKYNIAKKSKFECRSNEAMKRAILDCKGRL